MARWLKNPLDYIKAKDEANFWASIEKAGALECWRWKKSYGGWHRQYPQFSVWTNGKGVHLRANRVALALTVGFAEAPEVSSCLHRCDNKWCVNPAHLYWGTANQNAHDKRKEGTRLADLNEAKRQWGSSVDAESEA